MVKPAYFRQSRTPYSEQYQLMEGEKKIGHLDLHFTPTEVYGTLVLEGDFPEDDVLRLRDQIDSDLVESADVPREDFVLRVFRGHEFGMGIYSDDLVGEEYAADGHQDEWE